MRKLPLFMVGLGALLPVASPLLAQQESEASTGKAMIETACRDKDFAGFFEGFSRASWPERQAYLAPSVRVVKNGKARMVPRAAYTGYDIMLVDYSYATASSFTQFEAGKRADFDKITHNAIPLPKGDYRVDWSRGTFAITGEDEAEESLVRRFGPAQSYSFRKTASCWQLAEDRTGAAAR